MPLRLLVCVLAIVTVLSTPALAAPLAARDASVAGPASAVPARPADGPRMRSLLLLRLAEQEGMRALRSLRNPRVKLPGSLGWVSLASTGPNAARITHVIHTALAAVGTPYRWAGSTPAGGLDCSGLTRWAWAHGGVELPHNSGAQAAAFPTVTRGQLQPGDLLFFYRPISHVALYVGRGQMIDAVTSQYRVILHPVWWDSFVGAARPLGPVR
jgi:cell wall-associated NlpC family hydrolase